MGRSLQFVCDRCGYEATVSGGPDAGMLVSVRTMSCSGCQNLVDVIQGVHAYDEREEERLRGAIGRCPKCRRKTGLEVWGRDEMFDEVATGSDIGGMWKPCPRCDGGMAFQGSVGLWD